MNKIILSNAAGKVITVGDNPIVLDAYAQRGYHPDPLAPCPEHVEVPGQNCPTCGF